MVTHVGTFIVVKKNILTPRHQVATRGCKGRAWAQGLGFPQGSEGLLYRCFFRLASIGVP